MIYPVPEMQNPVRGADVVSAAKTRGGRSLRRPLPLGGGGLSALAPEGAKRLRRLGRKGEGVAAAVSRPIGVVLATTVSPSPSFSRFASGSPRERALPHQGGGDRRVSTFRQR